MQRKAQASSHTINMGGPTILDFSKIQEWKKPVKQSQFNGEIPCSSQSPRHLAHSDVHHHHAGSFKRTVLFPAAAALVVFVTMKQLATGPKIWQAAEFVALTVQQKADQVRLHYHSSHAQEDSYSLAYKESYGFFDYISDEDWKFRQHMARTRQDHVGDVTATDDVKSWYMLHYYPAFSCPHVLRIGRTPGPGPKNTCDAHLLPSIAKKRNDTKCLVYSVGNPWHYDFELGLQSLLGSDACEIHIFHDGSVESKSNINLHEWNIKSSQDGKGDYENGKTLQETMKELGHEARVIDILKIDCEKCDSQDWVQAKAQQILVQTRGTPVPTMFETLVDAGYMIFAKEPDIHPWRSRRHFLNVEWSFIRLHPNFSKGTNDEPS